MKASYRIFIAVLLSAMTQVSADEETYWDTVHPQLDVGIFIFGLEAAARLGAGGTTADFTALGIDDASFALSGRFTYEQKGTRYYAECWSYAANNVRTLSSALTWDGDTFLAGESPSVGFDFTFWGLGVEKILFDKPAFRFAAVVGLNITDFSYTISDGAKGGALDETAPALTVGFIARYYINERWTVCLDMVGLSWTDLFGMDGGFFDPSGEYRMMDAGFMWSNGGVAAFKAGYRSFGMRYEDLDKAFDVAFDGAYIGLDLRW